MPSANFSSELAKVKATGQPFVDRLFSADPQVQWESVNDMRNLTAGNRRQKANFIVVGAIPRLVYIIQQNDCMDELKRDCITLLTSLAKGGNGNVTSLCDYGACDAVITALLASHANNVVLASVRFLRTILLTVTHQHQKLRKNVTIESFIFDKFDDEKLISRLVEILEFGNTPLKISSLEIIAKIASSKGKCLVLELIGIKLLDVLLKLLDKNEEPRLVAAGTRALATLLEHSRVGRTFIYVASGTNKIQSVVEKVLNNYRVKPTIIYDAHATDFVRANAAQCLVCILSIEYRQQLAKKVCNVLSELCDAEKDPEIRIQAASSLTKLLRNRVYLQNHAFYSNRLPKNIQNFFRRPPAMDSKDVQSVQTFTKELQFFPKLKSAAFDLLAVLLSEDETLRDALLIHSCSNERSMLHMNWLMNRLPEALNAHQDPANAESRALLISSLRCLRSISRSDRHLRTSLVDADIYQIIVKLYEESRSDEELMSFIIPVVGNFLVDFCPFKDDFVGLVTDDFVENLKSGNNFIDQTLSALINMTYSGTLSNRYKDEVSSSISHDEFLELVKKFSSNESVIEKLGTLLRNLIHDNVIYVKSDSQDVLMEIFRQMLINLPITEVAIVQFLHAIVNFSDHCEGVSKLCKDPDLLTFLIDLMTTGTEIVKTQIVVLIHNLLKNSDEAFPFRQRLLVDLGILKAADLLRNSSLNFKIKQTVKCIYSRLDEV